MSKFESFPVKINNTLSKKIEEFKPINAPFVGMYVCGPTVYGDPHLGHARGAVTFDVVYRYLSHLGYKVRYVRNITDVGHLEDEVAEAGEDKIAKKAKLEKLEPMEIVQRYTKSYQKAMDEMNVLSPSIEPTATGHIIEQIKLIEKIMKNGWAYEVNGSIYFDIKKYSEKNNYGELSGKILDDLQSGTRQGLEGQNEKKNSFDFALWKKASEKHLMKWDSPWGVGFPGWHLECTAMSSRYLGVPFDIHGGGLDLQFPHHECEIAQSVAAHGKNPVNYWMHNNMLTINGQKMSKSLGNFINLNDMFTGEHELLEKAYDPMTVRFFILQAHYGSKVDFSNEALQAAEKGLQKLSNTLKVLSELSHPGKVVLNEKLEKNIKSLIEKCYMAMSHDFNTAQTIATLFELGTEINCFQGGQKNLAEISEETLEELKHTVPLFFGDVLGLRLSSQDNSEKLNGTIELLIRLRKEARENKNYSVSDQIRDELQKMGIELKDERTGETKFTVK